MDAANNGTLFNLYEFSKNQVVEIVMKATKKDEKKKDKKS